MKDRTIIVVATLAFIVVMSWVADKAWREPPCSPVQEAVVETPVQIEGLSEQRDSLVVTWAKKHGISKWLALGIAHAEVWNGDSTAVNPTTGAIGLGQIHPSNLGRFSGCGENYISRDTSLCYMMELLRECIEDDAETLAELLNCYGGAKSYMGKRGYNYAVNSRVQLEWLGN